MIFDDSYFIDLMQRIKEIQQEVLEIKKNINEKSGEDWLDNQDVIHMLKISTRTLAYYRQKGILPSYRIEGKILYKRQEVYQAIERGKLTL